VTLTTGIVRMNQTTRCSAIPPTKAALACRGYELLSGGLANIRRRARQSTGVLPRVADLSDGFQRDFPDLPIGIAERGRHRLGGLRHLRKPERADSAARRPPASVSRDAPINDGSTASAFW
jgi:hypothetical protein